VSDVVDTTGGMGIRDVMDTTPTFSPRRVHPPKHAPHPRIVELRAQGWTDGQIADAIGASPRAVSRWAAGDTRPLRIYEVLMEGLSPNPVLEGRA